MLFKASAAKGIVKEEPIKTRLTRVTAIKKKENDKHWHGCGETGTLLHGWGTVQWHSCCGKQHGGALPDAPLSFLGVHPKELKAGSEYRATQAGP